MSPAERTEGAPTPGMDREQAVSTERMWAGFVTTDAGMVSGWHHHGEYESSIYVVSGALRMEFGPGGRDVLEAADGDFVYVAPHAIHREETRGRAVHAGRGAFRHRRPGDERRRPGARLTRVPGGGRGSPRGPADSP